MWDSEERGICDGTVIVVISERFVDYTAKHVENIFLNGKAPYLSIVDLRRKRLFVNGHLFITVLAYQFVQIIRKHLGEKGICDLWSTLRKTLASQDRITAVFRRSDGRFLHVRKATHAEPDQRVIYQALGIDMSPGGVKKMII